MGKTQPKYEEGPVNNNVHVQHTLPPPIWKPQPTVPFMPDIKLQSPGTIESAYLRRVIKQFF